MIRVDVALAVPADVLGSFGAGALIRIERATSSDGVYAEVRTIAVVGTTFIYSWIDAAGASTSWYRWRVSDSTNASQSSYSDPFQGSSDTVGPLSGVYGSLAGVAALFSTTPDSKRLQRLQSLLRVATDELIRESGGRDYFRHPATGTTTWTADGKAGRVLHLHDGVISLSQLELATDGATYSTVSSGDYMLRGDDPDSAEAIPTGEPYFHVVFTGFGSTTSFQRSVLNARLTGVRGWPTVPAALNEAANERARQLAFADPSASGSVPGMSEYAIGQVPERWPQVVYNFLQRERSRFMACRV